MNKEINDLESYHEGRHACRDKYKKSNLLAITPTAPPGEAGRPCATTEAFFSEAGSRIG